jgi:hypothetical protein
MVARFGRIKLSQFLRLTILRFLVLTLLALLGDRPREHLKLLNFVMNLSRGTSIFATSSAI